MPLASKSANCGNRAPLTFFPLEIAVAFSGLPDAFDRLLTISVLARLLHRIALECELID